MNSRITIQQDDCSILLATPKDIDRAFDDLKRDMNPDFTHVFLDKIQRYALKPDRALFLARHQETFIAFATIINHSPPPDDTDKTTAKILKKYACATGLMVLPEYRHQGIASRLVKSWENWTLQNNIPGVWIVTRQMADWYQRCFHYSVQNSTLSRGVKKIILTKDL
ncbi:MAG: GNAT family N-acetyltransferase [Desulfocapsa sp.]|nr:GNAT family N-acetyltransferase [Desulfocapsa sp.]